MKQSEILSMCKSKGINCTYMTIYRIGIKEGFYIKGNSKGNCFDKDKFIEWLDKVSKPLPKGCMYLNDAVKVYNVNYSVLSYNLRQNGVAIEKHGYERGGYYYAKKSDIEHIVNAYNQKTIGGKKHD